MNSDSSSSTPNIPLFYEQIQGQETNVVERLLRAGGDPNTADGNWGGSTLVHNIASDQALEVLSLLFDFNANSNTQRADGATPLVYCARVANENEMYEELVNTFDILLKHDANPNISDHDGWMALHHLARVNNELDEDDLEKVKTAIICLLQAGADPRAKAASNWGGGDSRTVAEITNNDAIRELLLRAESLYNDERLPKTPDVLEHLDWANPRCITQLRFAERRRRDPLQNRLLFDFLSDEDYSTFAQATPLNRFDFFPTLTESNAMVSSVVDALDAPESESESEFEPSAKRARFK